MESWHDMLGAVLSVFAVLAIGAGARRVEWLTAEADRSLLLLIIRVLIPCLIFSAVVGNDRLRQPENLILPPLVGFGGLALGLAVSAWSTRLFGSAIGLTSERERRTFAFCTGVQNWGYLPVPLITLLFDERTLGVLFVHNVGVELAFWTIGVSVLTGGHAGASRGKDASGAASGELTEPSPWWRRLVNAPGIAIVLAVGVNLSGGGEWLPGFFQDAVRMLGRSAIPLGLILVGATAADHFSAGAFRRGARTISAAAALRLVVLPAVIVAVAVVLPCSVELKRVMVVEAAMPAAVFPIVMARHYGGDPATALRVVVGTSAIAVLTVPAWLSAGSAIVGLP